MVGWAWLEVVPGIASITGIARPFRPIVNGPVKAMPAEAGLRLSVPNGGMQVFGVDC